MLFVVETLDGQNLDCQAENECEASRKIEDRGHVVVGVRESMLNSLPAVKVSSAMGTDPLSR